eukprot:3714124-Amphidinium_carterae.1
MATTAMGRCTHEHHPQDHQLGCGLRTSFECLDIWSFRQLKSQEGVLVFAGPSTATDVVGALCCQCLGTQLFVDFYLQSALKQRTVESAGRSLHGSPRTPPDRAGYRVALLRTSALCTTVVRDHLFRGTGWAWLT